MSTKEADFRWACIRCESAIPEGTLLCEDCRTRFSGGMTYERRMRWHPFERRRLNRIKLRAVGGELKWVHT